MTTTNLSDFGYKELELLEKLLCAMRTQGLPADFDDNEVTPVMNQCSGDVFLSNSEYQVAMMNGDKLESYYTLSSGEEGFAAELHERFENGCIDNQSDLEQLAVILAANGLLNEVEAINAKMLAQSSSVA